MSDKILTSWHPAIRWLLLPIACILCPFILSMIVGLIMPIEGSHIWDGRGYYEIGSFDAYWYKCIQSFAFGAGFIIPIIYTIPSHTKTAVNIVRSIMLVIFIGLFIWLVNQDIGYSIWDYIKSMGHHLCLCLGLFIDKIVKIEI